MSESEPLITQCPKCQTRFRVTGEQLDTAAGRVRCGACLAVFQGRAALAEDALAEALPAQAEAVSAPPVETALDSLPEPVAEPLVDASSEDDAAVPAMAPMPPVVATNARKPRPVGALLAGHLVAWALLAAGVLALQFDTWSRDPVMRDVYERIGDLVDAELPAFADLESIRFTVTSVAPRQGPPELLELEANLVSTAAMRQSLPMLLVRFLEEDGDTLAEQRVQPADYLPNPRGSRTMRPGVPIGISLRLTDPGAAAVAYSVTFQ